MKRLSSHIAFLPFLLMLVISGCVKEIPYKGPVFPPELVVNTFFSPDSVYKVHLSLTQNIVSNDPTPLVPDAIVSILDTDSSLVEVVPYSGGGYYTAVSKPAYMKRYLLKIEYNSKVYWSSDSVPTAPRIISVDTSTTVFQGKNNFFSVQLRFKDSISTSDNYRISVIRHYREYTSSPSGIDSADKDEVMELQSSDIVILDNEVSRYSKTELLFTDELINGNNYYMVFGAFDVKHRNNSKILELRIVFDKLSDASYLYTSTLNEHLFYQNDPFSQPVDVKGNIKGGYGVFGAYARSSKTIKL